MKKHSVFILVVIYVNIAQPVHAISIPGYNPDVYNLFQSGFNTENPVLNAGGQFIGQGYDWSGVGWNISPGDNRRVQMFGMLSPVHAYSAWHANLATGEPWDDNRYYAQFVNSDGMPVNAQFAPESPTNMVNFGQDRRITRLSEPLPASSGITLYRLLDTANNTYTGMQSFLMGSVDPNGATTFADGPQVVSGTVTSVGNSISHSLPGIGFQGGDSGAPQFIAYNGQLTLAGATWFANGTGSTVLRGSNQSQADQNPIPGFNEMLAQDGFAVKWVIYDNPSDSARTANRWTGGGGSGNYGSGANWSLGSVPDGRSLVFGAVSPDGQTTVNLGANRTARGLLFEQGSGAEFTITGNQLTLGPTGIRNESGNLQRITSNILLADSQNWEAESGALRFDGEVNNAGYLIVVGGADDTTINGVVSGAGGLAKDDAGILTLNAANQYQGATFLHNGTLKIGVSGAVSPDSDFVLGSRGFATLDLNGYDTTLGRIRTVAGSGTSRILLGGAQLTVATPPGELSVFGGGIEGTGRVVKTDGGTLAVTGGAAYTGETEIAGGALRLAEAPANSNVILSGGVLEIGYNGFFAQLGTGAGQVRFADSGGFSAYGGNRVVNFGGAGETLAWGQEHFVGSGQSLKFSSVHSDSTVEFANGLNLGGQSRTVEVANGSAAVDVRLSGNLSNGGLTKTGEGLLELTGNNTYTGETRISAGRLLVSTANSLSSGNLTIDGGVLMLGTGDFVRSLGTGADQVRFLSGTNGGFAAFGEDRRVNLGGSGATLSWNSVNLPSTFQLHLSAPESNATLIFENSINLIGTRTVRVDDGSAGIDAVLGGNLSNGNLTKTGEGVLELAGTNTYGNTRIAAGGLLVRHANALGNGTLTIGGNLSSVLILGGEDFTRSTGTGAGQVNLSGHGGFAALGGDRKVNLGGNGQTVVWGQNNFTPSGSQLVFGNALADGTVIFENGIDLNDASRSIRTHAGTGGITARLTGVLSNGGLIKRGEGVLELATNNTYTGTTQIIEGSLLLTAANSLGSGNLMFDALDGGGVLILGHGDFTRSLGTGAGQVRFVREGGFAAFGEDRKVNLGGASATLTWGSTDFLRNTRRLVLSHELSDATLIFENPVNLGGTIQTIHVNDGSADIDARLTGSLANGGLRKTGRGTLDLTGINDTTGNFFVDEGRLMVSGSGAITHRAAYVSIQGGVFDYRSTAVFNRGVILEGGRFLYNSSQAYAGILEFHSGTVGGTGNMGNTEIVLGAGQAIAPGNSIGTLLTGSQTWGDGGVYEWEIGDWNGTTPGEGWDLLNINGTLSITAENSEPFVLRLQEFGFTGFVEEDRSFVIATASGGLTGFDTGKFALDTSGFAHGSGQWLLGLEKNSLLLHYAAVPEPGLSALFLAGATISLCAGFLSKKRRAKNPSPAIGKSTPPLV